MKQFQNIRRGKSLIAALSAALAILLFASSLGMIGEVYAKPNTATTGTGTVSETATVAAGTKFTVNYSSGAHAAFGAKTYSNVTADISGCITLPGATFKDVASLSDSYDCETIRGTDGRYYSFTGWHIKNASTKLPAETVFQPGDVITPEVLSQYATNNTLNLEALWGKVYFIQNKYSNMKYEKVTRYYYNSGWKSVNVIALNTKASGAATIAYDYKNGTANKGYTPDAPIATIDHLYRLFSTDKVDPLDAYGTVAMLTGDLDYVKSRGTNITYTSNLTEEQLNSVPGGKYVTIGTIGNEYVDGEGYAWRYDQTSWFGQNGISHAVTFKSSQKTAGEGKSHNFRCKVLADEGQFRGSTRFDNVNLLHRYDKLEGGKYYLLGDQCGTIARMIDGTPQNDDRSKFNTEHYFETTSRFTTKDPAQDNAHVSSAIYEFRASAAERVVVKGGLFSYVGHSWDDAQSSNAPHFYYVGGAASVGDIYFGTTDTTSEQQHTFPVTVMVTGGRAEEIYTTSNSGMGSCSASGNRTIRIYGGQGHQPNITNIYAGGYGAPLTGDVDVKVLGCTNVQNVYGGGMQYTADVKGNIDVYIKDSTISGNVYGGGKYGDCLKDGNTKGNVTVSVVNTTVSGTVYGSGQGNINTITHNNTDYIGGTAPDWWDTPETGFPAVNQNSGSIVLYVTHRLGRKGGEGNGASSVIWMKYTAEAYLSVAQVQSSTINISNNSKVGTVYGGGYMGYVAGDTRITVNDSEVGTIYGGSDGSGTIDSITMYSPCDNTIEVNGVTVPDYKGPRPNVSNGQYTWSDSTNKATNYNGTQVYDYEVQAQKYTWASGEPGFDSNTHTVYSRELLNAGVVGGNTHITIGGSSKITGDVYGGGKDGVVRGNTNVQITGGEFRDKNIYGGGKGASASVTNTNLNITGGQFGYARPDDGKATGWIYGGGYSGPVNGNVAITMENFDDPVYYGLVGGGYNGTVGSITINLTEVNIWPNIYGGGDQTAATVRGNITLNINNIIHGTPYDDKDKYNPTLYGGGCVATVNGNIVMNLTNGVYEWIHGGGYEGVCHDVTINLRGEMTRESPHATGRTATGPALQWCLRGGGDKGSCEDVVINMWSGEVGRNTHTAGAHATVASATFNMYGGCTANIFGGGDWGVVLGNSRVNLYGGTVGTIYGGSDRPSSRVGGSIVVIDDNNQDPKPYGSGFQNTAALDVCGNIYGGCDQGIVMPRGTSNKELTTNSDGKYVMGTGTTLTFNGTGRSQVEIISGKLTHDVFAGSNGVGDTSDDGAKEASGGNVFGSILGSDTEGYSSKLLITGGTVRANVYGGNNVSGQIAGNTLVEITNGTVNGNVFGGNLGSSNNTVGASIAGTAIVRISGGTVGASGYLIFGGNSTYGTVGNTDVQITNMNPLGSPSVYGGNNAGGKVNGQAEVTVTNSDVTYVFGGNYNNGTVGSTLVTLTNSNADNTYGGNETDGEVLGPTKVVVDSSTVPSVYGGNYKGGIVTGLAEVEVVNNSTVTDSIFGGSYENGSVGSTKISLTNSTCVNENGGVFGGNNDGGTVSGDTEIIIDSNKFLNVYGGNKSEGIVNGSTHITISRGVSSGSPQIYGGNNNGGSVHGDANITVNFTTGSVSRVIGGNFQAGLVAGKTNIIVENARIYYLLVGGNYGGGTVGTLGKVGSGTNIHVTGAIQIDNVIGGNFNDGVVNGNVNITLDATTSSTMIKHEAIGGNYTKGTINGDVTFTVKPNVDVISVDGNDRGIYGGNRSNGTVNGNTTVNLEGSADKIPVVCGGNYINGKITGLATLNISGGTIGYVYGGNNNGGSIGTVGDAKTGVAVNMTGGIVENDLYGGSNLKGNIAGEINVTMTGGRVKNRLYGGGNKAEVTADVTALNLTFGGTAVVKEENKSGGWAYAGGNNANCQVKTRLTIQGECYVDYLFGGGSNGSVLGTHVEMSGGEVPTLFGGSDAADKGSVKGDTYVKISGGELDSVRGGGNWADTHGSTYVEVTGGIINERINGAGNKSIVTGNAEVVVKGGTVENIFGGGDSGNGAAAYLYGDATVRISDNANITGSVYGAGNNQWAHSYGNTHIQISGGTIGGSVYGGGNMGFMENNREKNATANGDTSITITGGSINGSLFGGGKNAPVPGDATVTVNSGSIGGRLFGGGEMGEVGGNVALTINNGTFAKSVFGGGHQGAVAENVTVNIANGSFADNVYGGGEMGKVVGDVTVTIIGGNFNNIEQRPVEVYGGGKNATVNSTKLSISGTTNIYGNVFGGGEGQTATVAKGTEVLIDIPYDFQVDEQIHFTDDIQSSGQTDSKLFLNPDLESGSIVGSVYGGGNLGQVGVGVISAGGDKATIETVAKTKVKIVHGYIGGSVFGGGRGIPPGVTNYNIRMGTVFGSTDVDILGGLIMGNVYGGGEQSRVYASGKTAATVDITETATSTGFEKIGIYGSVFGGGDRGESGAANASVPTVYGDVYVTIQGHKDNQPSEIYFITGGVYGDGNLCLVDGYRKITVKDFEPSPDKSKEMLKTFHSLQRADLAVLDNSAVVLLGAKDLVEEGDSSVYSINRIGKLELRNGSAVKLDQIVKYLGGLYSDLDVNRGFINKGHNGTNNYTGHGGTNPGNAVLNVDEINQYHDGTSTNHPAEKKNVVCVANGLYLEVINEQDIYGAVNGLFTLQLTYANPGEGGGFVYASIPESTGDFICETKRWTFKAITDSVNADNYENLVATNQIFIRVPGKGFRRPPVGGYSATEVYYERVETMVEGKPVYMDIIDNVGGLTATNGYTYYYWYIGGPSVTFDVDITGYIGAGTTAFQANSTLPQHASVELAYVLYGVDVNEAMRQAIKNGVYQLVQTSDVDDQQIALELRANGQSLGFLYYDSVNNVWGIQKELDNGQTQRMTGYAGNPNINVVSANQLISMKVGANNDQLTWVFHKSAKVTNTCSDLEVLLDIDLYETKGGQPVAVTTGTSSLSYTIGLNIVRLTATQSAFVQNGGNYNGVATNETVHITGSSKFTVEWQTRYVPAASPKENGLTMTWALSTQEYTYYMSESSGEYFTCRVGLNGKEVPFNYSDGMKVTNFDSEFVKLGDGSYKRGDAIFSLKSSFASKAIPARTRITMVDMNGSNPAYYYYICTGDETYIDLMNFKQMGTNTMIRDLADSQKPAFIWAYDAQTMAMITERLVFVFDLDVQAGNEFTGSLTLQHMYDGVDILDYGKDEVSGNTTQHVRYWPKKLDYTFNPGSTGVSTKDGAYKVAFKETAYSDIGTAVLNVHVEEDIEWINTLFRENGFAVKVSLVDSNGNSLAMPAGMYFEYRGEHYYPGPDSTYVSVPVMEFGDHEIIIHNPQFSLKTAVGGDTATFKVEYYSAPDANYYDSFDTGVSGEASYQIIESPSYSLRVVSGDAAQIYESKDIVALRYTTDKSVNAATERVKVTVNLKNAETGEYDQVDWQALFSTSAPGAMAEGNGVNLQWKIADNAALGTYRLIFTYADHTEYVNIIVK